MLSNESAARCDSCDLDSGGSRWLTCWQWDKERRALPGAESASAAKSKSRERENSEQLWRQPLRGKIRPLGLL